MNEKQHGKLHGNWEYMVAYKDPGKGLNKYSCRHSICYSYTRNLGPKSWQFLRPLRLVKSCRGRSSNGPKVLPRSLKSILGLKQSSGFQEFWDGV